METCVLPSAYGHAVSAYRAGRLAEAERLCQQIIGARPDFFDAIRLLAVIDSRLGQT
jgi:predicted Zn-dependent protease